MTPSIRFKTGDQLVLDAGMLPQVPSKIKRLYADFETSSGDPRETSVNPWFSCTTIGAAVTWDDMQTCYFIPRALMLTGWWQDVLAATEEWCNHNVKYDAHVSHNDLAATSRCALRCTLTAAKLVDSDRMTKGGYGLDVLSKAWIGVDLDEYYWSLMPYVAQSKDYGDIPIDILAEYACAQVQATRQLTAWLDTNVPEESSHVWQIERRVTDLLVRIERQGVCVNPVNLQLKQLEVLTRMIHLDEEMERIVGRSFRAHVNQDCYDVLIAQYGLPVLDYTETGGVSFDKAALKKYMAHPEAPERLVQAIVEYRTLHTFNSLFLDKYSISQIDGLMHSSYNQCIRTGRMSCSDPNMQQLSGLAKELIIPPKGYVLVSADGSQIEFRFIVHYIESQRCIQAYLADPWTDFHQWVADEVPTERGPAKTINFMLGYGGGKKRTVEHLSINKDVVGDVVRQIDEAGVRPEARQAAIAMACQQRALGVYNKYHALLPELKPTTYQAADVCKRRGYARNWYGRRRHLPPEFAHKAFNSLNQSSAGDYIKERMVTLDDEMPELIQIAQVHDQVLGLLPEELVADPRVEEQTMTKLARIMNETSRPLKVPLRTSIGWSRDNWLRAQKYNEYKVEPGVPMSEWKKA